MIEIEADIDDMFSKRYGIMPIQTFLYSILFLCPNQPVLSNVVN